jgi:hypothetical protein
MWAVIWESGVSPILAPKLNSRFPPPLRTPHLLNAVRGYPEKVKSQVISVTHIHLRYFFSTANRLHQLSFRSFQQFQIEPLRKKFGAMDRIFRPTSVQLRAEKGRGEGRKE